MNLKVSDAKREEGFTLIELLVVVIIIGILAAIAIPVFLNQRQRAWQGSAESDARNAAIQVETDATREGDYSIPDAADVQDSDGVSLWYTDDGDATSFRLCAEHVNVPGESVVYDSDNGGLQDWDTLGGVCPAADFTNVIDNS